MRLGATQFLAALWRDANCELWRLGRLDSFVHSLRLLVPGIKMPSAPSSLAPPSKRRKVSASSSVGISINSLASSKIVTFESSLTEAISSNASLNPLADLLLLTRTLEDPKLVFKAIYATYRVFVLLLGPGGKFEGSVGEEGKAVRAWIMDRVNEYAEYLGGLLKDDEVSLRVCFHFFL